MNSSIFVGLYLVGGLEVLQQLRLCDALQHSHGVHGRSSLIERPPQRTLVLEDDEQNMTNIMKRKVVLEEANSIYTLAC